MRQLRSLGDGGTARKGLEWGAPAFSHLLRFLDSQVVATKAAWWLHQKVAKNRATPVVHNEGCPLMVISEAHLVSPTHASRESGGSALPPYSRWAPWSSLVLEGALRRSPDRTAADPCQRLAWCAPGRPE